MAEQDIWFGIFRLSSNSNPPFTKLMTLIKEHNKDPLPYLFDQSGNGYPNLLEQSIGWGDEGKEFTRYLLKRGALDKLDHDQAKKVMGEAFATGQKHILIRVGKHPLLTKEDFSLALCKYIAMPWNSEKHSRSLVKIMIDFGADPNYKLEGSQDTVLHRICDASRMHFEGAAEYLIEAGVDVLALNDDGDVALTLCDPVSSFKKTLRKAMADAEHRKLEEDTPPATGSRSATRL